MTPDILDVRDKRDKAQQEIEPSLGVLEEDELVIPLIDFSLFLEGTPSEKSNVGRQIVQALKQSGFLYLKNHGIPPSIINEAFGNSKKLFARPQHVKDTLTWSTPSANLGYVKQGLEQQTEATRIEKLLGIDRSTVDLSESMTIVREGLQGKPNQWPEGLDADGKDFTDFMKRFFGTLKDLYSSIMGALALGMGQEERMFKPLTETAENVMGLTHYPSMSKIAFQQYSGQGRAREHRDCSTVTIRFLDRNAGLQVESPRGTFIDLMPEPDAIIVNAGDILARWTDGEIKSTRHRFVEPLDRPKEKEWPKDNMGKDLYEVLPGKLPPPEIAGPPRLRRDFAESYGSKRDRRPSAHIAPSIELRPDSPDASEQGSLATYPDRYLIEYLGTPDWDLFAEILRRHEEERSLVGFV
ncbi:hypothetical protein KEM55_001963 [Ascosphaera atra]|nr:hypothetical protein KEM55_001963 [Ascosphaera atra]